ncbi:FecR family protein [Persicitalea jodogahamensis]|uniref:FecR family protein n=1 Tax=Persicitalea jodogahamensis TaxID=402147 RepID=A0A8J3D9N7_9BACT|nr:FecR family protein [Persicitalea jodogahamensis]GHB80017.1 hypothetical protein GCM10007390_37770 [Persicitalea jodogahamensis]
MKNYQEFTAEDFIRDESFRDWVQGRSLEETFWPAFLQNNPGKKAAMHQAELVIRASRPIDETLTGKEIRQEVQQFLRAAEAETVREFQETTPPTEHKRWAGRWSWTRFAAAALVLIVAGLAWYILTDRRAEKELAAIANTFSPTLVETNNPTAEPLHIRLADDSEVVLSPNSRLSYPASFADSARIVYLTGEASFSVQRQDRPFLVVTGEMITKVLGTQFVVRAFDADHKFSVQVISGKVSVSRSEPDRVAGSREVNGLILTANQAAIFEKDLHQLTKTLVANPIPLKRKDHLFESEIRFDETPLPNILKGLEEQYGVPIQFDESAIQNCRITATLSNETLYEKLDLLCKTVSASYEIVDGQIVLSGRGCK